MAETSRFWNGTTVGDAATAPYDADLEFSKVLMSLCGAAGVATNLSAVFRGELNELAVTGAVTPVSVASGRSIVWGTWYENDAATTIAIPTPGALTRIDRIVARKSWAAQTVRLVRIAGTEGGAAPALVQVLGTTWDEPIAQVSITTGGVITITDQRAFVGGSSLPPPTGTNSVLISNGGVASWASTFTIGGIVTIDGSLNVGTNAGASMRINVNAAAANTTTIAFQSAGVDVWFLQRVGASSDLRLYNATVGAPIVTFINATNFVTFGAGITVAGLIQINATGQVFNVASAGTLSAYGTFRNTGGAMYVGMDNSASSGLFISGVPGYTGGFVAPVGAAIRVNDAVAGINALIISPAGLTTLTSLAVTGTTTLTGATTVGGIAIGTDNLAVNAGFEVWQRGGGAFTATNAYTADRWQISLGGSSTISILRNTANADTGSFYCAACTYTHNAVSYLWQKIEDWAQLRGRVVTFKMRVNTSTASAVRLGIDTTGGASITFGSYHTGAAGFQTLTVTATISAAATGVGIYVQFGASCTAYLDSCTFALGTLGIDYVPLTPALDLLACQRYYEIYNTTSEAICNGQNYTTAATYLLLAYKVQKAIVPTVTITNPTAFRVLDVNTATVALVSMTASNITAMSCVLLAGVASGLIVGYCTTLISTATASIAVEANP